MYTIYAYIFVWNMMIILRIFGGKGVVVQGTSGETQDTVHVWWHPTSELHP